MRKIRSPNIREVRGLGLMVGIKEMKQKVTAYMKVCRRKIIALNAGHDRDSFVCRHW
ncbi:MAG: hypothetical protein IPN96_18760 [Anaerolineales bacterium]|nr:hypothetical protein [Anaerolineales bacterium]